MKALEAIRNAGMYFRAKRRWIGDGYMLTVSNGTGDVNAKAVTVFVAEMERRGDTRCWHISKWIKGRERIIMSSNMRAMKKFHLNH
ncbi:hypothetical protein [Paenibacillus sp. FSL R5-0486]|uniref:hypothetical protein n=1 Tax=Paenibacillus sp. FSL R5-0486 TaxID=2921645 RepID=UPI0030DDDA2B